MGALQNERDNYADHLNSRREAFERTCAGLTPEQLAARSVPPSSMSLLGMVRHLAEVERIWFRRRLDGGNPERLWGPPGNDDDWEGATGDHAAVDAAWAAWRAEVAFAQEWLAAHDDMGGVVDAGHHGQVNVRDVIVHLIEEYAQHLGHADLLRESIDGTTSS
ncbi:DinB family protein [Knoellia sp. Soil729]|uniref:DinB family protein n=1 Tax=Knoellia sp. Soil729 TaxID=1736394 RepID=UPI000A7B57CE|nr:DinB family protein [Knoellia sp. Soil729]